MELSQRRFTSIKRGDPPTQAMRLAVNMRLNGHTWRSIGQQLGVSHQRAVQMVDRYAILRLHVLIGRRFNAEALQTFVDGVKQLSKLQRRRIDAHATLRRKGGAAHCRTSTPKPKSWQQRRKTKRKKPLRLRKIKRHQ